MCRSIKQLRRTEVPVTEQEMYEAALQYVRKISGFNKPSQSNEAAFNRGITEVAAAARNLLHNLSTNATPKNREEEARKARERAKARFA